MMSARERVEAVLMGKRADRVPFTVYECMIPQCEVERRLRNEGLCIVQRLSVFGTEMPDVIETVHQYRDHGVAKVRHDYRTPVGDLYSVDIPVEMDAPSRSTMWHEERLFKQPEDYRALEFMIRNRVHRPDYGPCLKAQSLAGNDVIVRAGIGYEPLQEIIISLMGLETFSLEWATNRDELLLLYRALQEDRRKIYPIVAASPARHANYGGNVVAEVVGPQRFEQYLLPDYQECAEVMHKHGKLVGTHLDANNRAIASGVAALDLDYIEAFTPAPDSDMSVAEALAAWPDKVLWINFPSSVHLQPYEAIKEATLEILRQALTGERLIVGITEDVPNDHWQKSYTAISEVLQSDGHLPLR